MLFYAEDVLYLELWDGQRRDLAQVILAAGDLCFEVLKGHGAVALSGHRHEPVLGHDVVSWVCERVCWVSVDWNGNGKRME